jgi:hypothetical protein
VFHILLTVLFLSTQNHKSTGVAQILYAFKNTRRLSQISAMPNEDQRIYHQKKYYSDILKDPVALKEYMENARETYDRALQVGGDVIQVQTVTFEDCLFIGNSVGPEGVLTQDGVIFVASPSNVVILKNCTFQDNDYGSPVNGVCHFLAHCVYRIDEFNSLNETTSPHTYRPMDLRCRPSRALQSLLQILASLTTILLVTGPFSQKVLIHLPKATFMEHQISD